MFVCGGVWCARFCFVCYRNRGLKPPTISSLLELEGIKASRQGILKFLKNYKSSGSIARRPGGGRPSKFTEDVKRLVEERMQADDETTAMQLHQLLTASGYELSKATVLRCRSALGWTFRGSSYCQLIREANKEKRLSWALTYKEEAVSGFEDVVWTDESSIQLETHRRFCCRKKGTRPKNKPRYILQYILYMYIHTCTHHAYVYVHRVHTALLYIILTYYRLYLQS